MHSRPLQHLASFIRADLRSDTERGRLIRSTAITAGQGGVAALLAFMASLVYARALGPHGYGQYAYVIAWVAVLSIPAAMGIPPYLVREGAKSSHGLHTLRRWADSRIVLGGIVAMILMASVVFVPYAAGARWLFVLAAPLPLLRGAASVRSALIHARGYVARSQWPRMLLGPGLTLIAFSCLWVWRGEVSAIELMIATVSAGLLVLVINSVQLSRIKSTQDSATVSVSTRDALSFMWIAGLFLLNSRVDLIILGSLKGAEEAGMYAVASRAAELTAFLMATANMILGPKIVQLYNSGDFALLQRMVNGATRRVLVFSVPVALVLIVGAKPVLTRLYGDQFADGAMVLQILAVAQLLAVASGPLSNLLNMTGHEKLSTRSMFLTVLLNVVMNILLIPRYGAVGAAVATAFSLGVSRILLWYFVRRYFAPHRLSSTSG